MVAQKTTQPDEAPADQLQRIVEAAFAEVPNLYTNGFVNGLGLTDSYLVLQANGRSLAVVNMSVSVAKTLGQSLLAMVESYEQQSGQTVATIDELQERAQEGKPPR
jgi:hypothetical protein